METRIATIERITSTPAAFEELTEAARDFIHASRADATIRAYRTDMADFAGWCSDHAVESLPATPEAVALYLTDRASSCKASTLQRRITAISQAHQAAGFDSPTATAIVRTVWRGIRRTVGTAYSQKSPATVEVVRSMVAGLPPTVAGIRDRAVILLGFAGAFRRSELVALDVEDLSFGPEGVTVTIRRSKTDQEGEGRKVGIPFGKKMQTCPVRALTAWMKEAGITTGPIFRAVTQRGNIAAGRLTDRAVALIVKKAAEEVGFDPSTFAGHSLRAGLATSAAACGVAERDIMAQTGHTSEKMVRRYIRNGSIYRNNAAGAVGL